MTEKDTICCNNCGQLIGNKSYDETLWDLYDRMASGVQFIAPLVFTGDWYEDNVFDEDDHDAMMLAMSRDMCNRRLCPGCHRPDLRGLNDEDFISEEDYDEIASSWEIEAQERRMGA